MAATQFPTWFAGSQITAAGLTQMEPYAAIKPGPQTVTSSTALVNDADLQVVLSQTAGTFIFDGFLLYTGAAVGTGDLKLTFNYTGTSSYNLFGVNGIATSSTTAAFAGGNGFTGTVAVGSNGGTFTTCRFEGAILTTGAGTLQLQWAQNTSSATGTQLKQGCWLRMQQIA